MRTRISFRSSAALVPTLFLCLVSGASAYQEVLHNLRREAEKLAQTMYYQDEEKVERLSPVMVKAISKVAESNSSELAAINDLLKLNWKAPLNEIKGRIGQSKFQSGIAPLVRELEDSYNLGLFRKLFASDEALRSKRRRIVKAMFAKGLTVPEINSIVVHVQKKAADRPWWKVW